MFTLFYQGTQNIGSAATSTSHQSVSIRMYDVCIQFGSESLSHCLWCFDQCRCILLSSTSWQNHLNLVDLHLHNMAPLARGRVFLKTSVFRIRWWVDGVLSGNVPVSCSHQGDIREWVFLFCVPTSSMAAHAELAIQHGDAWICLTINMFFTRKKKWWLFACVFVFYIRPCSRNRGKEERVSVHRRTFMIGNLDCCRVRGRINLIHMAVRTYGDEIESWRSCAPVILNIQRGWRTKS